MKNLIIFVLFVLVTLSNCSLKKGKENSFLDYHNSLPELSLPYTCSSMNLPTSDFESNPPYSITEFEKYRFSEDERVCLGKLNSQKQIVHLNCVMGDQGWVPFINIYSQEGKKIQSISPFKNAGQGIGYLCIETFTIENSLDIQVIDSTWSSKITEDGNDEIEGTEVLKVTKRKIKFNPVTNRYN